MAASGNPLRSFADNIKGAFIGDVSPVEIESCDAVPQRPGVPLLLPAALAMWATAAAMYTGLFDMPGEADFAICSCCVLATTLAALIVVFTKAKSVCVIVCFALLGCTTGAFGATSYAAQTSSLPHGEHEAVAVLTSDMKRSAYGSSVEADIRCEDGFATHVRLFFSDEADMLTGARMKVSVRFSSLKDVTRKSSYDSGITATATVESYTMLSSGFVLDAIYDLRAHVIDLIARTSGDRAGIMQALVCGYRNTIQENGEYELFKQCGLAHIVAVSGAHLAIVTMVFGLLLKALRAPRRITCAASIVFVAAYLVFSGIPISAIRAAIMVVLSLIAGLAKRRATSLNALAICIIAFLVLDPTSAVSVSLFLSAGSTLGILLFASLMASWFSGMPKPLRGVVGEPLGLTLSAGIATMPFSVAVFNQLPLISPIANVVTTPLFTMGCVGGLASTLLACIAPATAEVILGIGSYAVWPLQLSVDVLCAIPYACIALAASAPLMIALSAAVAGALWYVWPVARGGYIAVVLGIVALCLAVAIIIPGTHGDEITMLDVGQGDAILIRSGSAAVLVDTGNQDAMLRRELASLGVFHLDAVAITHPDADHCESLASLFTYVEVDRFLCASDMLSCSCDKCEGLVAVAEGGVGRDNVFGLGVGDVVEAGRMRAEVVWPAFYADEGGNGDSLCMLVHIDCDEDGCDDWSALLTGDAESDQLASIIDAGKLKDIDVLKVGHHGSKVALTDEITDVLDPEVALISVGASNRYGHPSKEVLEVLAGADAQVYRTDECGSVTVSFMKEGIQVE